MECAQIEITCGSGTANPELVSIPGVYPVSSLASPCERTHDQCEC